MRPCVCARVPPFGSVLVLSLSGAGVAAAFAWRFLMGRTGRISKLGLLSLGLFALASVAGCQPNETNTTSNGGNGGNGGSGAQGGDGGAGAQGGDGGAGAQGGDGGSGAMGGNGGAGGQIDPCSDGANPTTVYDVTKGNIGQDIKVQLDGVIAMSHKHLISHSSGSGSCLWGIFVSAPQTEGGQQLTETAPYSGVIVLSYGDSAPADMPCPTGTDAIADDAKPGDVLDVIGRTSSFILNSCGDKPTDTDVPQTQVFQTCKAAKVGTAAVPAPHVMTDEEITLAATQIGAASKTFHEQWGGVKLKAEMVASDPWAGQMGNPDSIVGPFGKVKLAPGGLEVPDNLYYVKDSAEICETAPKFDDKYDLPFSWDFVQGFHYLAFCTWSLANEDKCADYGPQSPDCESAAITSCHAP